MSAIGPGDWVEALHSRPGDVDAREITAGGLYCVEEVDHEPCVCFRCGDEGPGFSLVGDPPGSLVNSAWCGCDFKPIYRPKADLIETLMTSVPLGVPA